MPVAYDIGMHNGDDANYYLAKGYDVIAVEANPALCRAAADRFRSEVDSGRLTILNVAISDRKGEIDFYLHGRESEWSSIVRPADMTEWTVTKVKTVRLVDVIDSARQIGLIKIDIEGADLFALESLDAAGLAPHPARRTTSRSYAS